jgi:signal transduction histidine kinase
VLTNFLLFGRPVPVGGGSPLKESISLIKSITLSHTQDIFSLQFSALSFADPERSRYRYELEGLETGWNETDSSHRSATYTTLGPGTYTFRVQGRANRGPWNENGASLRILVLPPWWRTWRFITACAALILFSLSAAYKFRLRRLAWQFNMRLEERVGERTRIARELHDTLLQSFQGLLLLFQSARNFLPERPAEAARSLDDALLRADQAITEGRDAIHGLRSSAVVDTDLEKAMTALGEELATSNGKQNPTSFGVLVEGAPQSLDPIVRDEIYRIAREALRNAFHYAQARRIETEITYGELLLRLRIRDDGNGIEPAVLGRGSRAGHWGLPGMRERAQRIGAQLNVWSQPGAGTEIELSIPGSIAYKPASPRVGFRLLRRKRTAHL